MAVAENDSTYFDIVGISISMRSHIYTLSKLSCPENMPVIITFGAGRFQEFREIEEGGFSFIAVDPLLDTDWLYTKCNGLSVRDYDFSVPFRKQVLGLAGEPSVVLCARCSTEVFLQRSQAEGILADLGIPAVFSFSISYHQEVISSLRGKGVKVFGCGYVHDGITRDVVAGKAPATMSLQEKDGQENCKTVVAKFGIAEWREPYLKISSLEGLQLIKEAMPTLWETVDKEKLPIMEWAAIIT